MTRAELKGLTASQTEAWAAAQGLPPFRARQIRRWIFKHLARSFDEMTDLPASLRGLLSEKARIDPLELVKVRTAEDGTRKYLFRLADGLMIESVLIPERDHATLCISSQVGCAMGCRFCRTARQGLSRNLSSGEIVDQVIEVKRRMERPEALTNIVFMGMGEPLANYEAVVGAVENLRSDDGMNVSHRRITLSTCGLVPQMRRLGQEATLNLAVSLNAADDETRNFLMPVNRRYPLDELLSACDAFPLPNRRRITFEYILIQGVNDGDRDAVNLSRRLSRLRAKINLIRLNAFQGLDLSPPSEDRVLQFQDILVKRHFTAVIRKSKGRDILAACGQLAGSQGARAGHFSLP